MRVVTNYITTIEAMRQGVGEMRSVDSAELASKLEAEQAVRRSAIMGCNFLNIWLHFLCALAVIAGVHSQQNTTGIHYQPFEADAVHNMMQSWINAGTEVSLLTGDGLNKTTPNLGWSFNEHPCYLNETRANTSWVTWMGIECTDRSYRFENDSLDIYSVIGLLLDLSNLDGMVDRDYFSTKIIGELPLAILNLTNLEYLGIKNAIKLSGPLPPSIFCYSNALQSLYLTNCSFNGSISNGFSRDPSICDYQDINIGLQYLDLSWNFFTEGLNDLQYFFNLIYLNVSNNLLNGEFYVGGSFIETIDLSNNNLTNIDFSTNDTVSLKSINVSNNLLNGEFFVGGSNIETVDLSNNFLTNIDFSTNDTISFKSIYVQQNSLIRFPEELFYSNTLQDINLDFNIISSISQNFSKYVDQFNISTLQTITMRNNSFQTFPGELLQFQNLEKIILDSNNITGILNLPNISCQHSSIKLISLLHNKITHLNPSNYTESCFGLLYLLSNDKLFLGGNPVCNDGLHKTELLRRVCRFNVSSQIEVEEPNNVGKSNKFLIIIFASISPIAVIALFITFFVIRRLRRKISSLREIQNEFDKRDMKPNLYSFSELRVATQDFNIDNELGRGGFGIVYKGVLPDGSKVAVKKLTKLSVEQGIQDFLSEIIAISNVKHRNLVQLKGCCIKENQRILVYEYVENNNLANALWGASNNNVHLDWPTRFNIILGIARGLTYLHEEVQPAIIHRDIKCSNILLDKDLNSKIADFGLALFFPSLDDGETHMSVSKVCGTMGYMAPEYLCYNQVSTKLDVFSFGVLLLEIISGRKNIDLKLPSAEQYLVQWVQKLHSNDNLSNVKDKSLEGMSLLEDASFKQVVEVGLQCLHHVVARRPTMSEVVAMLIGNKKVDQCAFEDYYQGSSSSFDIDSSSFSFTRRNSSLKHIVEKDVNLNSNFDSHKQSLQLNEIRLVSN